MKKILKSILTFAIGAALLFAGFYLAIMAICGLIIVCDKFQYFLKWIIGVPVMIIFTLLLLIIAYATGESVIEKVKQFIKTKKSF